MPRSLTRRHILHAALAALCCPAPALARSRRYALSPERSSIRFAFTLGGGPQTGTVPVARADIAVDPDDLGASRADVAADIRGARTGLIFATQALKSPSVLDAGAHPIVRYVSTAIILGRAGRISEGARIDGQLTLRGVTLPQRLDATLTRPAGSAPDDLSTLTVHLTGTLSRAAFGATGYPDLVSDRVDLDIRAEIRALG